VSTLRRWQRNFEGSSQRSRIDADGQWRRCGVGSGNRLHTSGVRGDPHGDGPRRRWESALRPGIQVHVRHGRARRVSERERCREVGRRTPGERESPISASRSGRGARLRCIRVTRESNARRRRFGEESAENGERGRSAPIGETHLIIARFRHLAPALNNALPLTHSLLPPLSIRPLCASMGRRDERVHGAFDPAGRNYIALRASRRVGAVLAAVRRRISRRHTVRETTRSGRPSVGSRTPRANRTIGDRDFADETRRARPSHALPHGRMNERCAALANKMRTQPHSTAPD